MTDHPKVAKRRSEKTPIFRFLAALVLPFMYAIAKFRIVDGDKLPRQGSFVLAPNHFSEIDPLVIGVIMWKLGRMPRFLAKASVFRIPVVATLLRASGQIPVERAGSIRGSEPLQAAATIAEKGSAVVIYPEGSLTRDPELWPMRGKTGAVRMALDAGVPLIPVAHWGTQLVLPRYGRRLSAFPRKTITVKIGDPVDLSAYRGRRLGATELNEATELVMNAITALLEDLRGEKAPAERWNPAKNNQNETGRF